MLSDLRTSDAGPFRLLRASGRAPLNGARDRECNPGSDERKERIAMGEAICTPNSNV